MVNMNAKEVVELFPFAARMAEKCDVTVNGAPAVRITVDELLAVVGSNPPMASVHEGYFDGTPLWAFYTAIGGIVCNYNMHTDMKVAEARALRDYEATVAAAAQERARLEANCGPLSVAWHKLKSKLGFVR